MLMLMLMIEEAKLTESREEKKGQVLDHDDANVGDRGSQIC